MDDGAGERPRQSNRLDLHLEEALTLWLVDAKDTNKLPEMQESVFCKPSRRTRCSPSFLAYSCVLIIVLPAVVPLNVSVPTIKNTGSFRDIAVIAMLVLTAQRKRKITRLMCDM